MLYGANAGPHAVTSAGSYSYQYDANGNMTSGKNKTLEYDVENRIIRITQPDAVASFMYDGDGGRVKVSRTADNETRTTTYIGSLFEKNDCADSGNQVTQIKHVFAGSTRVCSIESVDGGPADINYYHGDHLGSSSIVTDQNGLQVQHLEYAPYGTVACNEGSDVTTYKFTGKELDSTGLYFYSARYYDPEIGRFVSADTIIQAPYDPQSLNRYAYCRNNPVKYVDPSGHFFWAVIAFIAKAFAAISIGSAIAGGIACAAGNYSLASTFFQISQYSGYVSLAAAGVCFVNAAIQASQISSMAANGGSLASAFDDAAVNLGRITVTKEMVPNATGIAFAAAWQTTQEAVVAGVVGAVSAIGSTVALAAGWSASYIAEPVHNTLTQPGYNYGQWIYGEKNFGNFFGACLDSAWTITGLSGVLGLSKAGYNPSFYQYFGPNSNPSSQWVVRGRYSLDVAMERLSSPGEWTGMRTVQVPWEKYVGGPRISAPKFGKSGWGVEYKIGGFGLSGQGGWIEYIADWITKIFGK